MNTEIFYYSGTGFTLEAAKIAASKIGTDVALTPIVGAMKRGNKASKAKRVGLFLPMHAFGIPRMVDEFLMSYAFSEAEYIFALVTRGGAPTNIHRSIDKRLRKQGKRLDAFQYATSPNTFDIVFPIHTSPEMEKARKSFGNDVQRFASRVREGEQFIDRGYRNRVLETIVFPVLRAISLSTGYFRLQSSFVSDRKCRGCGTCERVCLSGKIRMSGGRPIWRDDVSCQFCLACLNLCPESAVQVRHSKTPERARIHFQGVDAREIAAQKVP